MKGEYIVFNKEFPAWADRCMKLLSKCTHLLLIKLCKHALSLYSLESIVPVILTCKICQPIIIHWVHPSPLLFSSYKIVLFLLHNSSLKSRTRRSSTGPFHEGFNWSPSDDRTGPYFKVFIKRPAQSMQAAEEWGGLMCYDWRLVTLARTQLPPFISTSLPPHHQINHLPLHHLRLKREKTDQNLWGFSKIADRLYVFWLEALGGVLPADPGEGTP